mmetsp:Transcript_16504/g.27779  ORF Transcript_16504/g.27779 Transcript_16504/m.27779 type:complete len:609 (+) Transcript_16504:127-1953(+)
MPPKRARTEGRHYQDDSEEEDEDKKEKMLKEKVQVDLKKIYESVYSTHKSTTLTEDSRRAKLVELDAEISMKIEEYMHHLDEGDGSYSLEQCDGTPHIKDTLPGGIAGIGFGQMQSFLQMLGPSLGIDPALMQARMAASGYLSEPKNPPEAPTGSCKLAFFDGGGAEKGTLSNLWRKKKAGGGCIREARCEVTCEPQPTADFSLSVDGDLIAIAGGTGWKQRSPYLGIAKTVPGESFLEAGSVDTGFYEPGWLSACSEKHNMVALQADQRIKLFDLSGTCMHTLQTGGGSTAMFFKEGRLFFGPNLWYWNLDDALEKHQDMPLTDYMVENPRRQKNKEWLDLTDCTMNDDVGESPEMIDVNRGVPHHGSTIIAGVPPGGVVGGVPLGGPHVALLVQKSYAIHVVDMATHQAVVALHGHVRQEVQISYSPTCPDNLLSAGCDGTVKLWDLRAPERAVLTLMPKTKADGCGTAALVGLGPGAGSVAFTGGADQAIRCWDTRAPLCLYELATGNMSVSDLQWVQSSQTLLAAGSCSTVNRHGTSYADDFEADDDDDENAEEGGLWPKSATHSRKHFPVRWNSSEHGLIRYQFVEGNVSVTPCDGGPSFFDF